MRGVSRRFSRSSRTLAALGFLVSGVFMLLVPAGAQTDEGGGSYARLSTNGWWERKPNPVLVPADAVAVEAEGGNPAKIASFGIDMFIPEEELLVEMSLVLKEHGQAGANFPPITAESQGQPQSAILVVACPITQSYTPLDGGDLNATAPKYDCDLARGDGVRNHAAGTWEFDLTSLAEAWSSNTIPQFGIVLVERVDAPKTFQVAFQDLSTNTPLLELITEPIEEEEEQPPLTEESFEELVDTSGDDNLLSEVGTDVTGTPTTPFGITDTPPTTAPAPEPAPAVEQQPAANRRATKGSLPLGTLALLPLAIGAALLFGVVLGPEGDPATIRRREGGLSRALARRSPTPQP